MNVMQKFAWDDSLKTGVASIDVQHKELIAVFNDLSEAIEEGKGSTTIKKILIFLRYYGEWHFEHEENCAMKHKCPMAEVNKQAHKKFMEIFISLNEEYRQSGASEEIARKIHHVLSDWLVNHIKAIDVQIGATVNSAGN